MTREGFQGDIEICVQGRWRQVRVQKTANIICHLQLYNRRGGYKSQSNTVILETDFVNQGSIISISSSGGGRARQNFLQ
jgi:hypothetical protein